MISIILPNMKAIRLTSKELYSQSEAGQTNKQTNELTTEKLYAPILLYAGHKNHKIKDPMTR
jgi:hypothetical protein